MLTKQTNKHWSLFFFLAICSLLRAEDFKRKTIDNITSNRILSIARDSTGYVWLGTDEGLNKYDGLKTTNYRSNIFDVSTLSSNRIWDIFVDRDNRVWILNDRGVDLYNRKENKFIRFPSKSRPLHLLNKKDSLFVTTRQHGLFVIDKNTAEKTSFSFDPLDPMSISSSRFSTEQKTPITKDNGSIWVGTTNGLNIINLQTKSAKRHYREKSEHVESDTILAAYKTQKGLLIGTSAGLVLYNKTTNKTKKIAEEKTNNIAPIRETSGVVILGNKKTLFLNKSAEITHTILHKSPKKETLRLGIGQYLLWSKGDEKTVVINIETDPHHILSSKEGKLPVKPEDILIDPENNIWIASKEGLFVASGIEKPTKFISHKTTNKNILFGRAANAHVLLLENSLYKSTQKEILKTGEVHHLGGGNKPRGLYISTNNKMYLYDNSIYQIEEGKTTEIANYEQPINTMAANEKLILASVKNSGLISVDIKKGKLHDYRNNRLIAKNLPTGATCIYLVGDTAWVGSDESGLYEIDVSNPERPKLIKHHAYKTNDPTSFASSSVSCLYAHKRNLFVGTNGDGIFIHEGDGIFQKISHKDGLPSNNIISLSTSSDSLLWALTKSGLSLIKTSGPEIKNIHIDEGLIEFIGTQASLVSTENGNALVMGLKGHYFIEKNLVYINEFEQKVAIESVNLIDRNNKKYVAPINNVKVTHKTPTINILYTSPSFYKANETTYSYFIEGYHETWIDNGKRRYIELQGLDPGSYAARIKSYNSDGYESKNTANINFKIIPPWWKTWWAYFSYAASIFLLFGFYVRHQKEAQAKATEDKRKEEELEEARQFQLDMLPSETPDELGLDISSTIKTATEVGGDYYDYFPQKDGKSLYVVVGDATGHGMTAGMMVSITKAGLYGIPSIPPNDIARRLNRIIKKIDLGWNRMAFNMARFWEDRVEFTSAAMPPVYHYHGDTGELDEVLLEGLPLGSIKDETFSLEEFDFNQGDSLVFISDGLPEAANHTGEMLGYEAVYNCIKANGNQSAEAQKQSLLDLGNAWLGDLRNQDDITIVVVKKSKPLE